MALETPNQAALLGELGIVIDPHPTAGAFVLVESEGRLELRYLKYDWSLNGVKSSP